MNSNDILAVVLNHKILNKKFCDLIQKIQLKNYLPQ
ncbi:Uncharacterised protein [Paenibacillus macerans]|nr:Uncharacterised protein [Paenibacillus macerans]